VEIQATISKTGTIENLHAVSGPAMLRQSALDAVKTWRYKPYLLDGEPVAIDTTVDVVFNSGQ
jgi:protein TonB